MAMKFSNVKGQAAKGNTYKYKDGINTLRFFGEVIPMYGYWLKTADGKPIQLECLSFDRNQERFTNVEKDHVQAYFPDQKCSWSYLAQAIDVTDGKVYLIALKKKLFQQIITTADDLGDPTDTAEGWDVVFTKAKTGSMSYNVEYTLNPLKCKKRALTEAELAAIAEAPSIDDLKPRMTPDEIKNIIETRILSNASTEDSDEAAELAETADDLAS